MLALGRTLAQSQVGRAHGFDRSLKVAEVHRPTRHRNATAIGRVHSTSRTRPLDVITLGSFSVTSSTRTIVDSPGRGSHEAGWPLRSIRLFASVYLASRAPHRTPIPSRARSLGVSAARRVARRRGGAHELESASFGSCVWEVCLGQGPGDPSSRWGNVRSRRLPVRPVRRSRRGLGS